MFFFDIFLSFFEHFLTFWSQVISSLFCTFPVIALKSVIAPNNPDSFLWRKVLRNQDLGVWCNQCYWGVVPLWPSQWIGLEIINFYIYTQIICKLKPINISVCVCAWTCAQLCPTLCDAIDCSLLGSSVHGSF